jgi:hypothetical protein
MFPTASKEAASIETGDARNEQKVANRIATTRLIRMNLFYFNRCREAISIVAGSNPPVRLL